MAKLVRSRETMKRLKLSKPRWRIGLRLLWKSLPLWPGKGKLLFHQEEYLFLQGGDGEDESLAISGQPNIP